MTPKQKAEELYLKYYPWFNDYANPKPAAKQCALIAVDEILETIKWCIGDSQVEYWQEVKQEIEKL
jgi:hypothetical protein